MKEEDRFPLSTGSPWTGMERAWYDLDTLPCGRPLPRPPHHESSQSQIRSGPRCEPHGGSLWWASWHQRHHPWWVAQSSGR